MSKKPKMIVCKKCNSAIEKNAKICPFCGAKNKKPFYKRIWFILLIIILAMEMFNSIENHKNKNETEFYDYVGETTRSELDKEVKETVKSENVAKSDRETPSEQKQEETVENEISSEPEQAQTTEELSDDTSLVDGMRPEFKKAMDSYEEFMNEYCDFMGKYAKSKGTDLGLLSDYADYMTKYADFAKDFEKWESEEMNAAETAYYLEVQARISKKLLEVEQ